MSRFGGTWVLLLLCLVADVANAADNGVSLSELREQNNGLEATRQDLDFLVRPNMTQWEQLLLPAPTVVSLLGQMVVLSSKIDVSLADVRPKDGWMYVQNPQSLRACLIQIGHKAWDAFRLAQRNMDEIQLTMAIVPKHLQSAIKIIKTMPPRLIGKILPKTLEQISQSAIISENLIFTTETAFINVMGLTEEIERSVATKQGIVDQNITANNAQISYTDKLLHKMNETAQMAKKQYDTISSEVEKARKAYEKAVKDIPTGWKALAMDIVRSVTSVVKNMGINSLGSLLGVGGQDSGGVGGGSGAQPASTGGSSPQVKDASIMDKIILSAATMIQTKMSELQASFAKLADSPAARFTILKTELHTFLNMFAEYPNTAIKQTAASVYGGAVKDVESLETAAQGTTPMSDEEKAALKSRIDAVVTKGKELTAAAGEAGTALTPTGGSPTGSGTAGGKEGNNDYDNEKFIVKVRQDTLQRTEERMDASFNRLFELNREMAKIEADLAALDITKINLQDIRNLLSKVLAILGKIREQWDSLIEFFQLVAVRTTVINRDIIGPFLSDTSDLTKNMDASERDAILSHVLDLAVDVNSASFFLHTIANTYVDVSHTYLLQKLAGLSQLLGAESDAERNRLRGELEANAASAREGIHVLIQGLRDTYKKKLMERRQQLKQYEQSLTSVIGTTDGGEDAAAIEKGRGIAQTVGVVLPDGVVRIL